MKRCFVIVPHVRYSLHFVHVISGTPLHCSVICLFPFIRVCHETVHANGIAGLSCDNGNVVGGVARSRLASLTVRDS